MEGKPMDTLGLFSVAADLSGALESGTGVWCPHCSYHYLQLEFFRRRP